MKKWNENIELVGMTVFSAVVFILSLPLMIVFIPTNFFNRRKFEKKYAEFLNKNNHLNFFCYNNRKNSKDFIETEILPILNNKIEILYLNGKTIENPNYPKEFLSNALYNLKNYSKFPHLMKIRNGKIVDKSINDLFYSIKNQNQSKDKLLKEIEIFFEITN